MIIIEDPDKLRVDTVRYYPAFYLLGVKESESEPAYHPFLHGETLIIRDKTSSGLPLPFQILIVTKMQY